ncbi:MAG: hypothetical protein N3G74_01615 [Candidatus Micrarchaeota archaeon]|nr:hypothetical protein [Candidatus Micrarchaeota archaeon]
MNRKEYNIRIEPIGYNPYLFSIREPKKEHILMPPLGQYVKVEDANTRFIIKSDHYKQFLDGQHNFKGHISLAPKTMNIVQHAEVICPDCKVKKLKYVLKSGTKERIEKEFNNYISLHSLSQGMTLYPIGYIIDKNSDSPASSFLFTKLETDVIPLSAIEFRNLIKEDRMNYIRASAELLALIHYNGYTHNDPKLKNFLLKKANERLMIIDLVKMNYSRARLVLDMEHVLSSPKMQAIRYDFLNFLGNAAYSGMISDSSDIVYFIKSYVKYQSALSEGNLKKGKPHEVSRFIGDLLSAISLHKTDKNIANLISVIKGKDEEEVTNCKDPNQLTFNFKITKGNSFDNG